MSRGPRLRRTPPPQQNLGILRPYDPFAQFRLRRKPPPPPHHTERDYKNARLFTESLGIGLMITGIVLVAVIVLLVVLLLRSL